MSDVSSPFRLESPDIAEYASHLAGPWELEYEQLEGGAALHSIEGLNIGEDSIYIERSNRAVGIQGCVEPGTILISSPSQASRRGRFWGQSLDRDCLIVFPSGREADVAMPASDNVEVTVDEDEFRTHYRLASGREPEFLDGGSPFLHLAPGKLSTVETTWRRMISGETPIPPGFSLSKAVAHLIAGAVSGKDHASRMTSRKYQRVRDAIAFWEKSNFEPNVTDICRWVGVSERTLGIWFQAQCGLSPLKYLLRRRLNLAHRALLAADPAVATVTEIAMRFKFHELGRFAGVYRRFFGEVPSRTLLRRSGESAKTIEIADDW